MHGALQEFRLPNEEQLLDALYAEFGDEDFAILLPSISQASRARGSSEVRQRLLAAEFRLVVVLKRRSRAQPVPCALPSRAQPVPCRPFGSIDADVVAVAIPFRLLL